MTSNAMKSMLTILLLLPLPLYADFSDNLRWSLDASARLNENITAKSSSGIFALGLDTHKIFTSPTGDVGYTVGQLYYTKLSEVSPYPWLFDSKNDAKLVIREMHINYTAGSAWVPRIRLGHFTLPFGLEESIDTNGRLLDYSLGKNLGAKLDWGIGINNVVDQVEYSFSYTLGGKDEPKSIDDSYALAGRIGTLSYLDFIIGFSFFHGEINNVKRRRLAFDWQYYWSTWGILGEFAYGKDTAYQEGWKSEKYGLLEVNSTSINSQTKMYSQYILIDKEYEKNAQQYLNIGTNCQINNSFEISASLREQLNNPSNGNKERLFRLQFRYRY